MDELKEFAKLVRKMRNKQNELYTKRKTVVRFDILKEAKELEKQVDQKASEIIDGKTGSLF